MGGLWGRHKGDERKDFCFLYGKDRWLICCSVHITPMLRRKNNRKLITIYYFFHFDVILAICWLGKIKRDENYLKVLGHKFGSIKRNCIRKTYDAFYCLWQNTRLYPLYPPKMERQLKQKYKFIKSEHFIDAAKESNLKQYAIGFKCNNFSSSSYGHVRSFTLVMRPPIKYHGFFLFHMTFRQQYTKRQ